MTQTIQLSKSILSLSMFFSVSICGTSYFTLPNYNFSKTQQYELIGGHRLPQSESNSNTISQLIFTSVHRLLPQKHKSLSLRISKAILKESFSAQLDPLFVLSMIQHESKMNPDAIGSVGEIGLMQIRPETALWLNKKFKITQKLDLKNPETNIKMGVFFLNQLRSKFKGNSQLYISAYNMGAANVQKNLKRNIKPRFYANKVMKHYVSYLNVLEESTSRISKVASN